MVGSVFSTVGEQSPAVFFSPSCKQKVDKLDKLDTFLCAITPLLLCSFTVFFFVVVSLKKKSYLCRAKECALVLRAF